MRVYVEHDMTVNHNTNVVTLKAGDIVEGPLAVYLVESNCAVTIEQDDRPVAETPAPESQSPDGEQSHTPGSGEQPEGDAQSPTEHPEGAEPAGESGESGESAAPGAAE